ncbi:Threonine/homoserine/homoserine lactone efflux protein [Amycolatopsis pretoriensis]|uniref:Threonine/homoserine/homoserine lactone efflux protein n=1 Tax=Amycolatopsis pretoriensis TaxID=218821 RepID=A0A1H5RGK6_9PSEU|nr:LysE family translocator [Amycolatopsis pretoriensis]SEF36601.1 Threonine/homoserine/homoserine lactone efflux protein [Amycolatopsis pretoriensis]
MSGADDDRVMPNLLAFIPAAFLIAMVPGPATVMLIKQASRGSKRNAFATIGGIEAGVAFWGLAAVFGLTALLAASQTAYDVLRFAGALFLIYLGAKALFFRNSADEREVRAGAGFRAGLITNVSNPKAGVFALSFLPQFVPAHAGAGALLVCVAAWIAVDVVWYSALALLVTRLGRWLRRENVKRWLERTSGGLLIGFGVTVALES